jgi:hypothetical protein
MLIRINDAGWSSWKLVGLITRRSQVRVLSPPFFFSGGIAQQVEQRDHNPQVVGSSPTAAISQQIISPTWWNGRHSRLRIYPRFLGAGSTPVVGNFIKTNEL